MARPGVTTEQVQARRPRVHHLLVVKLPARIADRLFLFGAPFGLREGRLACSALSGNDFPPVDSMSPAPTSRKPLCGRCEEVMSIVDEIMGMSLKDL